MIDVSSFGAVGDGVADDTSAIQSALNQAISSGETLFFSEGIYNLSAGLVGTLPNRSMVGTGRSLRMIGSGSPNCALNWLGAKADTAVTLTGSALNSDRFAIEGMRIIRPDPGPTLQGAAGAGLRLQNFLDVEVRDCFFFRHGQGLHLIGCLAVKLDRCAMYYNDIGLRLEKGPFQSSANLIAATSCVFGANYSKGVQIFGGTQQSFVSCTFETTGEGMNANSIAAEIVNVGEAGAVGPVFERCYFEGNLGSGIYWYSANDLPQTMVVQDCNFNRMTGYDGLSLILDFSSRGANTSPALLRLHGSTFYGYSGYTPTPAKPHLLVNVSGGFNQLTIAGLNQTLKQSDFGIIPGGVTVV